jgi:nucleoside-diphosphate-sugar epimerase
MKRILVTGGAGYLGSILCRRLLEQGYRVKCFDCLYFGPEPISGLLPNPNFQFIQGHLLKIGEFPCLLEDVDAVIHLADLANDPSCDLNPEIAERINWKGVVKFASLVKEKKIERFIFASSCSVYGQAQEELVDENAPLRPVSLYAQLKIRVEKELRKMQDKDFSPVLLRQATLFGYSPRMRFDLAINLMVMHALTRKKIFIMGGGSQWRPFLHVKDAAALFITCLEAPLKKVAGQTFNVGSNKENYQVGQLARLVTETLPEKIKLETVPEDDDRRSYRVSFDKIKGVLEWTPRYSAQDGMREIAQGFGDGCFPRVEDIKYYNIRTLKARLAKTGREDFSALL